MSDIQIAKARIYNYLILTLLSIQVLLLCREIYTQDFVGISIIGTFCFVSTSFLLLHYYFGLYASAATFNILYPLVMALYLLIVGHNEGVEYSFFVFMLTAIIFQEKPVFRVFLIIYNISLFIFASLYLEQYGVLLERDSAQEQKDYLAIFIAASICFAFIMYVFNQALERYDQKSAELIKSLQNKNDKLLSSNQELERFTYIASHDLKTPLRNIISFLGLMQRRVEERNLEDLDKYFLVVTDNSKNLYALIEETLEYSKIGQQEWKIETIDLNHIIGRVKEQLQSPSKSNISIQHDQLPSIQGDDFIIYKLFFNLIENGIKYNTSEKKSINISSTYKSGNHLISIQDNGIGMKKEYFEKIFVMYKRLHTKDEYQGTGIGLSTCKKIIEKMNGKIWVESKVGAGSTFHFSIPDNISKFNLN